MGRTGQQRLDAIQPAIDRRDEFRKRVAEAAGDPIRCADLMAEAIDMQIEANGMESVSRDGRTFVAIEKVTAAHCLISARDAYRVARGSNITKTSQQQQGEG